MINNTSISKIQRNADNKWQVTIKANPIPKFNDDIGIVLKDIFLFVE